MLCMSVRFVDTNVLLYAISREEQEQAKAVRANEILASREVALSVQVLLEETRHAAAQAGVVDGLAVGVLEHVLGDREVGIEHLPAERRTGEAAGSAHQAMEERGGGEVASSEICATQVTP